MKKYAVYRFDYRTQNSERIGTVEDRRKGERNNNPIIDMMRLAQAKYPPSRSDSHIFILDADTPAGFPEGHGPSPGRVGGTQ